MITKDSDEFALMNEWWQWLKAHYEPQDTDEWWDEVIESGATIWWKRKNTPLELFAAELVDIGMNQIRRRKKC